MSRQQVREAVVNYLIAESTIATEATATAHAAPSLPVTISTGVNDTFVFTGSGGLGTPETFTLQAGTFTTLAQLEAVMSTAVGSVSSEQFATRCVVEDNGTQIELVMAGTSGAADNGNTITAGNGGAAALGFTATATFAGGATGTGTIPYLAKVFGFPAKFTPEGELYPSDDPGIASGCAIYVYIGRQREKRIAVGGAHAGEKWVTYDVTLSCLFFSQQPLSQDAGADNESMLDGLVTAIRADRNCGAPGVVFQWAEGGETGGDDLEITSFYPQNVKGQLSATLTISQVRLQVIQVILT